MRGTNRFWMYDAFLLTLLQALLSVGIQIHLLFHARVRIWQRTMSLRFCGAADLCVCCGRLEDCQCFYAWEFIDLYFALRLCYMYSTLLHAFMCSASVEL